MTVIHTLSSLLAEGTEGGGGGGLFGSPIVMMVLLVVMFYFLLIRPQMKRAKEHKTLVAELGNGDEVVTNGGLLGKITNVGESFVTVELAENVRISVQKHAIASVMPKGTIKSA